MAKSITKDYYSYFSKFVSINPKSSMAELWNAIADAYFEDEGELVVGLAEAYLKFTLQGEEHIITLPREEVYNENFENYDLLIKMALCKMRSDKWLKKSRKKKPVKQ